MISIVLYGRNDNYGYNLHKRAALSLNCMAEVLTRDSDEILFVDYNTPNDFPTFPEAIVDTLTDQAKRKLRILRVRPEIHAERFGTRTHLKALEPVSRNVAVRRSNPDNRWILSTNTDMIFVPRTGASLTDLVADIPEGFYCTPRFEIPETLWESFDRFDAPGVIRQTRDFGTALHLNEVVLGAETILYDAPGDFQLISRQDMFDYHAFDEEMLLGWHVDSNISKRLFTQYGAVSDALPYVFGYHCDHTRQVTPMHRHKSAQNDLGHFVEDITGPHAAHQADTWGLADVEVEELSLTAPISGLYRKALTEVITAPQADLVVSRYQSHTFDKAPADPYHILPFLLDLFASLQRDTKLAWIGEADDLHGLFTDALTRLGFTQPVTVLLPGDDPEVILTESDSFIVNFGTPETVSGSQEMTLRQTFWHLLASEKRRLETKQDLRRIVAINASHNRFEDFVGEIIVVAKTPFSSRLRQGFIDPAFFDTVRNWTADMCAGLEGARQGDRIVATQSYGTIAYGPYRALPLGDFTALITLSCSEAALPDAGMDPNDSSATLSKRGNLNAHAKIEVVFDKEVVDVMKVAVTDGDVTVACALSIPPERAGQMIQLRVMNFEIEASIGGVEVTVDHDKEALEATQALLWTPPPPAEKNPVPLGIKVKREIRRLFS